MVTQTATKSKKASSKKTSKTCFILRRYEIKATGRVCCVVRNGENKEYTVCIDEHGHATCIQSNGENCPSRRSGHTCYHIKHVLEQEATRKERQPRQQEPELAYAPAVGGCYSFRAPVVTLTQAMAEAQQVPAPAPVEQEMHTPVFTIDDAMDMVQFVMEAFDSCALCGCRVKAGQNYCARC